MSASLVVVGRTRTVTGAVAIALVAGVAAAQPPGPTSGAGDPSPSPVSLQMPRLERIFEDAVARSLRSVERQLAGLARLAPAGALFAGSTRARGFVLEDYGVFFDVEFPVLRRSVLWSMRMLDAPPTGSDEAFANLRRRLALMPPGPGRAALGQALEDLEHRLGPSPEPTGLDAETGGAAPMAMSRERMAVDVGDTYLDALTMELTDALVSAGRAIELPPEEWLTVAARDGRSGGDRRFRATGRTLHLRIRSRDLDALRRGLATVDDASRRVEVRRR